MAGPAKPTAAAARRLRADLIAQHREDQLPPDFLDYLGGTYRPSAAVHTTWRAVEPLVRESLARSAVRGTESLKKHVTHLANFWTWALHQGLPLNVDASLTRKHVDDYARIGMTTSTAKSRADRRSRLRALADAVHPEQAPGKGVTLPRQTMKPPYTPTEMSTIRRVVQVQPTIEKRRQLCLCVGLGAGAGIDSADLRQLSGDHVRDCGELGITVIVPGSQTREPRQVTVLREYEALVRVGTAGTEPSALLLGRKADRRNVAGAVFERASIVGDVPHLEQSRLRSTWLTTLMMRPVPLAVILHAAGLRSARTILELLPYADVPVDHGVLRTAGAR